MFTGRDDGGRYGLRGHGLKVKVARSRLSQPATSVLNSVKCMLSLCPSTFSRRGRLTTAGLKMCVIKALIFLPLQLQATNKLQYFNEPKFRMIIEAPREQSQTN